MSDAESTKQIVDVIAAGEEVSSVLDEATIQRRVAELSKLSELKYAMERGAAAKELDIPIGTLDKHVRAQRPREDVGQGRAMTFPDVEPWPEPVDCAALINELMDALRRYVVLTNTQAIAVALWILFSHVHDAFDVSPRLVGKSAQKRSGKSTLFRVLSRVVAKPRSVSGITSSALLRVIERHQPTTLIDEMDALMAGDKDMAQAMRGMMNAGFDRSGATITMNVPARDGGYEPREFSCWAPMALAGIGKLPDTVRDRSIEIEMKRKLPTETVMKLRRRDGADLNELARKVARWTEDNLDILRAAEPEMPEGLNDRAADAWEPLIAVADLAGADWSGKARHAALSLSGENVVASKDENTDTLLLSDIHCAFESMGVDRVSGKSLLAYLVELEERPWADWNRGRPMSQSQMSRRLGEYHIISGTIRIGGVTAKGFHREAFEDAFLRYLPSPPPSNRNTVTSVEKQGEIAVSETVTPPSCDALKKVRNTSNSMACDGVTVPKGGE